MILATPLAITPYDPLRDRVICQPDDAGGEGWVIALVPPSGPALRLYAGSRASCDAFLLALAGAVEPSAQAQGHATTHLPQPE